MTIIHCQLIITVLPTNYFLKSWKRKKKRMQIHTWKHHSFYLLNEIKNARKRMTEMIHLPHTALLSSSLLSSSSFSLLSSPSSAPSSSRTFSSTSCSSITSTSPAMQKTSKSWQVFTLFFLSSLYQPITSNAWICRVRVCELKWAYP